MWAMLDWPHEGVLPPPLWDGMGWDGMVLIPRRGMHAVYVAWRPGLAARSPAAHGAPCASTHTCMHVKHAMTCMHARHAAHGLMPCDPARPGRRYDEPGELLPAIHKRLGGAVVALGEDLALPKEVAAKMEAGDSFGQQKGGGASKEVRRGGGGWLWCVCVCVCMGEGGGAAHSAPGPQIGCAASMWGFPLQ